MKHTVEEDKTEREWRQRRNERERETKDIQKERDRERIEIYNGINRLTGGKLIQQITLKQFQCWKDMII